MAIKVAVDTNVLVAGLIGGKGPYREILRRCLEGEMQAFIGNALYLEYQDLLTREHIQTLCKQTTVSLMEFLDG
jgi:predicted nucleic acid-binding protein